jgi:5-methylcytosine-specific restriction endonuclease McrA
MVKRNSAQRDRLRRQIARARPACHICGAPIDYALPYLHPKSFVIDHIIPLIRGGADTIDNVKAAHRDCNSAKRSRRIAPIVKRSGSLPHPGSPLDPPAPAPPV